MNLIHRIRRLAGVVAGLACVLLGMAAAAPAAFAVSSRGLAGSAVIASRPPPPVFYPCSPFCPALLTRHPVLPIHHVRGPVLYRVRTVVVGGMPGWQIALISIGAALVAAAAAVLLDRARDRRRRLAATTV
jgi:hypothetical protein